MLGAVWAVYSALVAIAVQMLVPFARDEHLDERLGRAPSGLTPGALRVVVHAVSAGEMMAAGAFVRQLADTHPEWPVVLTCGTREGRTVAERLQRQVATIEGVSYLPWDRADAVQQWLRELNPRALVVVEPEFWPNLFRCCHRQRVPLVVLNARVYPRDVWRYRLARRFMREVLEAAVTLVARSTDDVSALAEIGAPVDRIIVGGDLKLDAAARPRHPTSPRVAPLAGRTFPLLVAGSTHRGEEELLLQVLAAVRANASAVRLALAPRHVSRAGAIAKAVRQHGFRGARCSERGELSGHWDVLIVDGFGDLPSLYAMADIAVVGGTFVRKGGHNVLEPAIAGCATIVGPHVEHVRHLVEGLDASNGIVRLREHTACALTAAVNALLAVREKRQALADGSRAYVANHAGSARRAVAILERALDEAGGSSAPVTASGQSRAATEKWPLDASAARW